MATTSDAPPSREITETEFRSGAEVLDNIDTDRQIDTSVDSDVPMFIRYSVLTTITGAVGRPEFRDLTIRQFNDLVNLSIKNKNRNDVDSGMLTVALSNFFVESLSFTNDVIVVKDDGGFSNLESYDFLINKKEDQIQHYLRYNYNMTTGAVDLVFNAIVNNLSRDISSSPATSFTYDFKFCENQNSTILTGSMARRMSTRTTSGGSGGY